MTDFRVNFAQNQSIAWPLFVAWFDGDEHYYVLSDADQNLEDGPYSSRWQARRRAIALNQQKEVG